MKSLQRNAMLFVLLTAMMSAGGCIFDEKDDDGVVAITMDDFAIGGVLFVIPGENLAQVQIGTFDGIEPFDDAVVYLSGEKDDHRSINATERPRYGVELVSLAGFHFNDSILSSDGFPEGSTVRFAVYALGDSVVSTVVVPGTPVISSPAADAEPVVGEDLALELAYPGAHQVISFDLAGQNVPPFAQETSETAANTTIPGNMLPNPIPSILSAYSVNTSVDSPDDVDISADRFSYFLVASITARTINFVSGP